MEKGAKLLSLGSKKKNYFGEQFPFGSKFWKKVGGNKLCSNQTYFTSLENS